MLICNGCEKPTAESGYCQTIQCDGTKVYGSTEVPDFVECKYQKWIRQNGYHYPLKARNQCQSACNKMVQAFPELKLVRGWIDFKLGTQHWWCELEDGTIVDPTEAQFTGRELHYIKFEEGVDAECLGKCMNCGSECWDKDPETLEPLQYVNANCCSPECELELQAYYG